jgi:REP element-mobilizing transposase RayT
LLYHIVYPEKVLLQLIKYLESIHKSRRCYGEEIFRTRGYYANTVGQYENEEVIRKYVKDQERKYKKFMKVS